MDVTVFKFLCSDAWMMMVFCRIPRHSGVLFVFSNGRLHWSLCAHACPRKFETCRCGTRVQKFENSSAIRLFFVLSRDKICHSDRCGEAQPLNSTGSYISGPAKLDNSGSHSVSFVARFTALLLLAPWNGGSGHSNVFHKLHDLVRPSLVCLSKSFHLSYVPDHGGENNLSTVSTDQQRSGI